MARLQQGDKAPDFALQDQNDKRVSLADFKGQKVLVYFYPKADTPGCTKQACSIRDNGPQLSQTGIATLGISPDKPAAQNKFDEKYGLGFALLSDPDHAVAEAYGAWGEKKMFGKVSQGIIRSSFLVDEQGDIAQAWYKVKPEVTATNALDFAA